MAIIKKFSPKENLNAFSTFVTDTNPNSDYFRITEFKETFTGGRNGFLIEGSEHLKETTEIKIEILDVNGNALYFEPLRGIPEYYEGVSKLIAVYVYNDTPIGQAKITVLGELKTYLEGGVVRDIPDDWKGVYNVKWERTFKVNKLLANEDRVRFNRKPKVDIEEIVKPIFNTSIPTVVQSGSVNGIPNVPLQNQTLENYSQPTSYRLEIVGDGAWTGSVIGTTLEFGGIGYSPTVVDIINSKNIIVNPPYSVNNIVNSFTNEDYTASFQHIEGIVNVDTSLTGSFAKINITDLSTFVGDVARVKVFRKSKSNIGDFEFIQEIQLESNEILVDFNTIGKNEEFYGLFTDINIDEYWITSSNDITASFNQSYLYNSAKLDSNVGVQNFYTSNSLSIQEGVEYVLSFGVRSGLVSSPNYIQAFITGSRQSTLNGSPVTIQVRKDIVKINSTNFTLQKQDISQNFIAEKIDDAKLYFDVVGTDWYINNVSLKASQETAFSPDEITFIQPVPKTLQIETFDYKFEFYDINNNNIPINVLKTQTFTGGNTALLNRSLDVEPTNLFFTFDSASQSVGINVINFNIIRNLLTGSVTFTSGAFDASNTLISSASYVGQYPGLLTNISSSSATLTAANFTGSDATHTVQFITYTALCENLTDNVTIGRVSNGVDGLAGASGSSAKLLDISVSSPGFSFDDVSDTEATPPTITVSIKQQNLSSAVLTSDISITGSDDSNITVPSLSGTIVSGTGTQTFIISFTDSGAGGLSENKGKLPLTINVVKDGILERTTILKLEGGANAGPQYYLKPLTGTNLLNANGTLIVQASEILSSGESDVTSGPIKIFSGSLSGSQLSPLTGFGGSTDYFVSASSDAITGRLLLELKDETTGFVHDTIALLDQYDGLGGGSIVANSLVTIRDKNNTYSINPIRATASFFDVNVNEFRAEFRIEPNFNIGTLNDEMKFITDSVNENITLEFNDGDGVLMVNNSFTPTKDINVIATFTDPNSGAVIKETETFYISSDGKDGLDGLQVDVINQIEEVQCSSDGTPNEGLGPYTNTGTDIYVYEGTASLQYTTSTPSNGEWTVVSTNVVPNNITVGSITDGGDYAVVGNHSNLSAESVNINYNISGKRINGQSFALTGSQVVYKVFAGLNSKDFSISLSSPNYNFDNSTDTNATPNIITASISQQNLSGEITEGDVVVEGLESTPTISGTVTNGTGVRTFQISFSTDLVGDKDKLPLTITVTKDGITKSTTIGKVEGGDDGTPGADAYTINLSNEAVTLPTTIAGTVSFGGSGTAISVFRGTTELNSVNGTPTTNQFSASISNKSAHISATGSVDISSNSASFADITGWNNTAISNGFIEYSINVENLYTFKKTQSFALSYEGETGPGIVFRGFWTGSINYQYDVASRRRDAVLYDSGSTGNGVITYYATLQPSTGVEPTGSLNFTSSQYWEELGVEDFFVAAKIAIFEESFVKNTLNVGNNPGNDKANIVIQGSGSFPFIAIGQTGSVIGYEQPGIFMGTAVNDGQDIQRFSIVSNDNSNSLKWDGEELIVSGTIVSDAGQIGGWTIEPDRLYASSSVGGLFLSASERSIVMRSGSKESLLIGESVNFTDTLDEITLTSNISSSISASATPRSYLYLTDPGDRNSDATASYTEVFKNQTLLGTITPLRANIPVNFSGSFSLTNNSNVVQSSITLEENVVSVGPVTTYSLILKQGSTTIGSNLVTIDEGAPISSSIQVSGVPTSIETVQVYATIDAAINGPTNVNYLLKFEPAIAKQYRPVTFINSDGVFSKISPTTTISLLNIGSATTISTGGGGGGGVSSITAGDGLTGGTITSAGIITVETGSAHFVSGARKTISVTDTTGASGIDLTYNNGTGVLSGTLVTSSLTVAAGSGLTGGGSVSLGGTTTLTVDTGSAHFVSGARKTISVSDTTGASGINLEYNNGTGVLSGSLVNSSLTVTAGSGLTGGGSVSLGGTTTLTVDSGSMLPFYSSSIFSRVSGDVLINNSTGVATIQPDSVALGTDTTGNYVATLGTGTGVTIGSNTGEGSTPTIAVNYGSTSNTAVQGNTNITISGTANEIEITETAAQALGGGPSYTIGLPDSVTITNNLTVSGSTILGDSTSDSVTFNTGINTSPGFTSGFTGGGWRLSYSNTSSSLELDNLTVRGTMKVSELLINQIRATNGTLFVSSVGKVETVTGTSPTFFLSFDTGSGGTLGHGFAVGDVIRAQRVNPGNPSSFVYRSDLTVTGVSANGKFVTASLQGSTTAPSGGMEFVRLGNTSSLSNRQGTVYLTADDTNAPFIDVIDGVASHADWNTASGSNRLKTRMGRLDGITETSFGNLTGYGFYASGSAFLEGGINATAGRIANWVISGNSITSSNIHLTSSNGGVIRMGSALPTSHTSGTGIFLSGSGQALIGNAAGHRIEFDGSNVIISSSNAVMKGNSVEISGSNFHLLNGNITASNVSLSGNITATTGNIGGFAITANALTGSGFFISGGAAANGFFISSSGFNVKGNGNITASAGSVGGWNLSTTSLSQGNVNLLATAVSGGLFVTSGSERILTVGNFNDVAITTSPGLFATASLFRSTTNGTATIASSSNSLTIFRSGSTNPAQYVVTTVTQSLGTIQAGRVIALAYTYADLTTYTSSAATVGWNNTSFTTSSIELFTTDLSEQTGTIDIITGSSTVSGVLNEAKGVVSFTVSSSFRTTGLISADGAVSFTKGTLFLNDGTGKNLGTFNLNVPSGPGPVSNAGITPITASLSYTSPTTISYSASYEYTISPAREGRDPVLRSITGSLGINNLSSTLYLPAEFSASISSSGGSSLITTFKNTDDQPYSKVQASSVPVPTQLTNAKLIFTVKQLGSGSAYTNLPSYQISDILLSADLPKVNISRNQALFYNSPLQYMEWTTSSFDIKGDIDATSLTVRGTTNLLGPVNIEGDISAHPDIQGASSTGNSAGTVVQNLTFDTFGHTTGVSTTNLDSRYQPVGSYATLGENQTFSGINTFTPSSNPTLILGVGPSAFSGSLEFRGTTIGGTQATSVIRIKPDAASSVVVNLPDAGGTMAMLEDIAITSVSSAGNNRVLTSDGGTTATAEPNLTFNGSLLTVTGDLTTTGNAKLGDATSDAHTVTGSFGVSGSLQVNGQISGSFVRAAHRSSDGTSGINQDVNFVDASGYTHNFTFKDGLLTAYSVT